MHAPRKRQAPYYYPRRVVAALILTMTMPSSWTFNEECAKERVKQSTFKCTRERMNISQASTTNSSLATTRLFSVLFFSPRFFLCPPTPSPSVYDFLITSHSISSAPLLFVNKAMWKESRKRLKIFIINEFSNQALRLVQGLRRLL